MCFSPFFSKSCWRICLMRWLLRLNSLPHRSHMNMGMLRWLEMCRLRVSLPAKPLLQKRQAYGRSPVCKRRCSTSVSFLTNFPHSGQDTEVSLLKLSTWGTFFFKKCMNANSESHRLIFNFYTFSLMQTQQNFQILFLHSLWILTNYRTDFCVNI